MKQYNITTENINTDAADDAYLSPDDPIQELKIANYLGGLGSEYRLAAYRYSQAHNKYNTKSQ